MQERYLRTTEKFQVWISFSILPYCNRFDWSYNSFIKVWLIRVRLYNKIHYMNFVQKLLMFSSTIIISIIWLYIMLIRVAFMKVFWPLIHSSEWGTGSNAIDVYPKIIFCYYNQLENIPVMVLLRFSKLM